MMTAPMPADEAQRLDALDAYQIFGSGPELAFDRITSLAAQILDVPIALMSLVGEDTQWLKSSYGLPDVRETPRDFSFCAHAILEDEMMVVPDATRDPRFCHNPYVTGGPKIRFYAGYPLRTPSGHCLGTLCALDHQPRAITPKMRKALEDLADLVIDQLEFRDRLIEEAMNQERKAGTNYRRLAEAIPGMVFRGRTFGADQFEYLYMGPGCVELLGVPQEDFIEGRFSVLSRIHPDDIESFHDASRLSWESESSWTWIGRVTGPMEVMKWVQVASRSERQPDGSVIIEGVWYDVTEIKRREVALSEAKEAAERANSAKSEFLSRMSHELRTPLNAILGFAQVLEMTIFDAPGRRDVAQIKKAGDHLLGLINEVLDLSAVDAKKVALSTEPVCLKEVLQETVSLLRPLFASHGIVALSLVPDDLWVLADRHRLKQVAINLVTNAVKYNREDGMVVLRATRDGASVALSIADDGEGIAPEKLDRLFTPFERLGAKARGIEGTGLGLSISRGLVEQMGGSLSVNSVLGEGSTFTVHLPPADDPTVALAPTTEDIPEEPPSIASDPCSHRILYVEDNESNVFLIERILEQRAQARLNTVSTVADALDALSVELPDVLLLDLNLPDGSGETVLEWVRKESSEPDLPVIVLSADATPRQAELILGAGADHYLTKPLQVPAFLRALDNAVKGTRS